ncbi:MAG: hypothetical protein H3C58_13505 [Fimbriimonadaceae bacterium]|nr:hypothetical protein [Fimbriimonadaceae bacterium]
MTLATLLAGIALMPGSVGQESREHVQTLVLASSDQAEVARMLVEVAPRSRLLDVAKQHGYDVLKGDGPVFLVHRDYLSNGDVAFALDVANLMKGYEIGQPLDIGDFPPPIRDRLQAKLLKAYEYMAGSKPEVLPRFAAEPFPRLSVKTEKTTQPLTVVPIRVFAPGYQSPRLHPESEGYVAERAKPTIVSDYIPKSEPRRTSLEPVLFASRSLVEERRAIWATELWTELRDRLAEMRRGYREIINTKAREWLGKQSGFKGLEQGQCNVNDLPEATKRYFLKNTAVGKLDNPNDAVIFVGNFDFHIIFEFKPRNYLGMDLNQILMTDEFPR